LDGPGRSRRADAGGSSATHVHNGNDLRPFRLVQWLDWWTALLVLTVALTVLVVVLAR